MIYFFLVTMVCIFTNCFSSPPRTPKPDDGWIEGRRNCLELKREGFSQNGVYTIYIITCVDCLIKPIKVYCDMETDEGGWLVFQRRTDGSENFYRGWDDYKDGFGKLTNEFWLGNEDLNQIIISSGNKLELRVDLEDFNNEKSYAKYSTFSIGDDANNYRLTIEGYTGNAGDAMAYSNGFQFITHDRYDMPSSDCAQVYKGAWWYDSCTWANLNGQYLNTSESKQRLVWSSLEGNSVMKFTEMKIRPKLLQGGPQEVQTLNE